MPQLNPSPWLLMLLLSWITLLLVFKMKVSPICPPTSTTQDYSTHQTPMWPWPWA